MKTLKRKHGNNTVKKCGETEASEMIKFFCSCERNQFKSGVY